MDSLPSTSSTTSNFTVISEPMEIDSNADLSKLPAEIWKLIFSLVPKETRKNLLLVNWTWNHITKDLWDSKIRLWEEAIEAFQTTEWKATKRALQELDTDTKKLQRLAQIKDPRTGLIFSINQRYSAWYLPEDRKKLQIWNLDTLSFDLLTISSESRLTSFFDETKICFYYRDIEDLITYDVKTKEGKELPLKVKHATVLSVQIQANLLLVHMNPEVEKENFVVYDLKTCQLKGAISYLDKYDYFVWNASFLVFQQNRVDSSVLHIFDLNKFSKLGEIVPLGEDTQRTNFIEYDNIHLSGSILCATSLGTGPYGTRSRYIHFWLLNTLIVERIQFPFQSGNFCLINDLFITFDHYRLNTKSLKDTKTILFFYDIKAIGKQNDFPFMKFKDLTIPGKVTEIRIFPDTITPRFFLNNDVKLPGSGYGELSHVLELYSLSQASSGKRKKHKESDSTKKTQRKL